MTVIGSGGMIEEGRAYSAMLLGREETSGRRRESERLATTIRQSTNIYSIRLGSDGHTASLFGKCMAVRGKVFKAVQSSCQSSLYAMLLDGEWSQAIASRLSLILWRKSMKRECKMHRQEKLHETAAPADATSRSSCPLNAQ